MPPILSFFILFIFNPVFNIIPLSYDMLYAFKGGLFMGYILYDITHYYLHHGNRVSNSMLGKLKKHHMQHHYKNSSSHFGLTSVFWDYIFGTI